MRGPWLRLCAVFFFIGLTASRVTLVLHELAGHGGAAALLGGRMVDYHLFLFGGGWVRYRWGEQHGLADAIAVSLGGIVLEVVAAALALTAAWLLARRGRAPLARLALVGVATADLLHAGFYLAAGTHHGFGDGRLLHAELGDARAAVVWPVAIALVAAGFLLARRMAVMAGDWTGARSRAGRAAALVSAAVIAALAHGALTWSERAVAGDTTYSSIMKTESESRVERDLDSLAEKARTRGQALDERALARARAELERRHRAFPLVPVLAGFLALACAAGVWLGVAARRAQELPPPRPLAVARLGAVTAAALALVALLRWAE
jgi:hypothetical protein